MKTILITGGAGFIGSNFIRYVLKTYPDYKVVNLDVLTYAGNLENLRDIEDDARYTFVKGDIADEVVVEDLFSCHKPSVVINFAAETHVDRSILGPKHFIRTDVMGTFTLLEASKKYKIERYVQISTDEVYGSIKEGEFTEDSPYRPNSPYSASKAGGDHLVRAYGKTYGLPVIQTHSCNVFGPYQFPEKVIPLFSTNLMEGKKVTLYGDGSNVREWIYTEDYCKALDLIWHKGALGGVYNIGTEWRISNLELTQKVLEALDCDESMIEPVADRLGHDWRYAVDASRLREFGWKPEKSFEERLTETIDWYKNNTQWWKPLKDKNLHSLS
jgi:dTDP-glucose 4,6-dehydratase